MTTSAKANLLPDTFADWDENSLSAHTAMDAIRQTDRQMLAEYLDHLWLPLDFLERGNPGFDANKLGPLISFLIESAPVLAELASMLSGEDENSLRLIIAAPPGRPRKDGPLGKNQNAASASEALKRVQGSVAKYLRGLSDTLSALNHESLDHAFFSAVARKAAPIVETMVMLLQDGRGKKYRLEFVRP
jgi:hypothetical protein